MNTSSSNGISTKNEKWGRWLSLVVLPMLMVSSLAYGDIPIVNQKPHRGLEKQPEVPSDIGVEEIEFLLAKVDNAQNVPAPVEAGMHVINSGQKFNLKFSVYHTGKKAAGETGVPDLKAHYVIMCGGSKKLDDKKPVHKPYNNSSYDALVGPFDVKNGGKSNLACTFSVTVEAAPGTAGWTDAYPGNNYDERNFLVAPK